MIRRLPIPTRGQGLYDFTSDVRRAVADSGIGDGLCTLFIRHTSASLIIQENADPGVQRDLQAWLSRLVPEGDPLYTHNDEGPDDMPAHVKAALTNASLAIPVANGELLLGQWQGVYLWEHRRSPRTREVVVHVA